MRIDHISAAYNMRGVSHDDTHLEETILMQSMWQRFLRNADLHRFEGTSWEESISVQQT